MAAALASLAGSLLSPKGNSAPNRADSGFGTFTPTNNITVTPPSFLNVGDIINGYYQGGPENGSPTDKNVSTNPYAKSRVRRQSNSNAALGSGFSFDKKTLALIATSLIGTLLVLRFQK